MPIIMDKSILKGFSKFTKEQRIKALTEIYGFEKNVTDLLLLFESADDKLKKTIEDLSENPISAFHLPFSIAPNFVVNNTKLFFPLVTEESSVVAALANAASYWAKRGGFKAEVLGTEKKGQVHFKWKGNPEKLNSVFAELEQKLITESAFLTANMEKRGGGIKRIALVNMTHLIPNYFQLDVGFETCDAMGANFINSCLEQFANSLQDYFKTKFSGNNQENKCEIIMSILSNYTPESKVKAWVECNIEELLEDKTEAECLAFANKFEDAIKISKADVSRAVTHNKGIFNGIDALAIATGNDFRAIEACAHAFASRSGRYSGLTDVTINNGRFRFSIEIAFSVGVIGGVTAVHPLSKLATQILYNPTAKELMIYLAVAGLASNFAAIKALVSVGIQKGHMKMHIHNILNQLNIPEKHRTEIVEHFSNKTVSFSEVELFWKNHENENRF